jgi:biopolymer transport protein ExbD
MKIGRRFQEEGESIQLAPLIDIVFLTLVFFMTTAVYTDLESEIDITLPTAQSGESSERASGEIYINVRNDGKIIVHDRERSIEELQEILNRMTEHFPGGGVIIRGDREAVLGRVVEVLDCCKQADIQNISFSVMQPAENGS